MAPNGQKQTKSRNCGVERHDHMSMRQLTEALSAVTDQPVESRKRTRRSHSAEDFPDFNRAYA